MTQQIVKLSADANYFTRIRAWLDERFPPANGILSMVLFFAVAAVMPHSGNIFSVWTNWAGGIVLWGHFFVLRVFDEHKDYEIDMRNHPHRVIQSGVVKLSEIRPLCYIVIALQIAFCLYRGDLSNNYGLGYPIYAWALMFAYTCLMGAEFFIGEWLQKRLLVYAATHMLVMPLMAIWSAALAGVTQFDQRLVLLAFLFFCGGGAYEIVRKIRAPESEVAGIDTYSSILGYKGASYLTLTFSSAFLIFAIALLPWSQRPLAPFIALAVLLALHILLAYKLFAFCKAPTPELAESNDKLSGLHMAGVLATLIVVCA